MPNDALFEQAAEPTAGGTPADQTPAGTQAAQTPASAFDPAQVQPLIEQATAPLAERMSALQRENDALRLAIQQSQRTEPTPAEPTGDDFVAQFNRDPAAAIKSMIERGVSEGLTRLAQPFDVLIRSGNEAFLNGERARVEQEFGPEAWDKVFRPQITETFAKLRQEQPFAIADISRVRREVDTIIGSNFTRLAEMRDAHLKSRTQRESEATAKLVETVRAQMPTGLTGGFRPASKPGGAADISPEMRSAIADMERATGEKVNLDDFARKMAAANARDIDQWLAAQPKGRAN
jgi:hypothetical protein